MPLANHTLAFATFRAQNGSMWRYGEYELRRLMHADDSMLARRISTYAG
jgi:hypothetical protein